MTRWSTAQPYCPAVPSTRTLSSPTPWLSAATAVPAGLTAMSAHTGPAVTEPSAPNPSDVSTRTPAIATSWSHSDSPAVVVLSLSYFVLITKLKLHDTWMLWAGTSVILCTSLFYCAFVAQHVCAAALLLSLQWGGLILVCIFVSSIICPSLYAFVCWTPKRVMFSFWKKYSACKSIKAEVPE